MDKTNDIVYASVKEEWTDPNNSQESKVYATKPEISGIQKIQTISFYTVDQDMLKLAYRKKDHLKGDN